MKPAAAIGQAVGALRSTTVMDLARKLDGVDLQQIQKPLGTMNYLYRRNGNWAVYVKYRDVYFAEKAAPDGRSVKTRKLEWNVKLRDQEKGQSPTPDVTRTRTSTASKGGYGNARTHSLDAHNEFDYRSLHVLF